MLHKARVVKKDDGFTVELDLVAPLLIPKVCVVRALVDRMTPGQQVILRSNDLAMPWEMEHMCNRLGHELLGVEREGSTYFFQLRVRGDEDRLPKRDPFRLNLSPQNVVQTIDITPDHEPWRLKKKGSQAFPRRQPALKARKG
jgi:TusA-related sulfurtransferase